MRAGKVLRQQPKRKFEQEEEDELDIRLRRPQLEALGGYSRITRTLHSSSNFIARKLPTPEFGFKLRGRGLHAANAQHIRARLKDSALQSLLSEIDSCSDAERALDNAMLEPRFQLFADEVRVSLRRSQPLDSQPLARHCRRATSAAWQCARELSPSTLIQLIAPCSSQPG